MEPILMMTLATALKGLAVAVAVGAIIALLKFRTIIDWFQQRTALAMRDRRNVAFTLQDRLKNGHYRTVQGIFSPVQDALLDAQGYCSREVDSEIERVHSGQDLVVYQ